jgi:hypothetical protein
MHQRQFLDAVLVENPPGLLLAGVWRSGDELLLRSHHVGHLRIRPVEVADVAAGDHALEVAIGIDHRESGETIARHDVADLIDVSSLLTVSGF